MKVLSRKSNYCLRDQIKSDNHLKGTLVQSTSSSLMKGSQKVLQKLKDDKDKDKNRRKKDKIRKVKD